MEAEEHLGLLKKSILGVAIFAWVFGMIFPLHEYIFMYWAITGAIYVGGAGSVIIGGFYWKRATTAGAWAGMISGSTLAFTGVLINNVFWPIFLPGLKETYPDHQLLNLLPEVFCLDGVRIFFYSSLVAIPCFVVTFLLTKPDPDFDIDKLLYRGKYAKEEKKKPLNLEDVLNAPPGKAPRFSALLGIDEAYTPFDKFIAYSIFAWTIFWFLVFLSGMFIGANF